MNRRSFIKYSGSGLWVLSSASMAFGSILNKSTKSISLNSFNPTSDSFDPIQLVRTKDFTNSEFNGDNVDLPHDILWNVEGFIAKNGGLPRPQLHVPAVVIGGGMSGLLTQYFLTKKTKSFLLEQDSVLGGNSKGEQFKDSTYSIGAAYITVPDEGSVIDLFLKETGLISEVRHEASEDVTTFFKKQLMKDFSKGTTASEFKYQFKVVSDNLKNILENYYPDIPYIENSGLTRSQLNELDQLTFIDWLRHVLKEEPHPHLLEYFQLYCWSSFAGSLEELSCAQVINFVASETAGILALPGGNSKIASVICEKLKSNTNSTIKNSAFVLDVRIIQDKVQISYLDSSKQIVSLTADQAYVCCPKNIAARIIKNLPADQEAAFKRITYRGYLGFSSVHGGMLGVKV